VYPAVIPLADSMAPAVVGACRRNTGKTMRVFKREGLRIARGSKPGNCYAATAAALSLRRMLNHRMML